MGTMEGDQTHRLVWTQLLSCSHWLNLVGVRLRRTVESGVGVEVEVDVACPAPARDGVELLLCYDCGIVVRYWSRAVLGCVLHLGGRAGSDRGQGEEASRIMRWESRTMMAVAVQGFAASMGLPCVGPVAPELYFYHHLS